MTKPSDYGAKFFSVKTPLSKDGEILLWADKVAVLSSGALVLYRMRETKYLVNFIFPPGQWLACYAASCTDLVPVAVQHWCEISEQ